MAKYEKITMRMCLDSLVHISLNNNFITYYMDKDIQHEMA